MPKLDLGLYVALFVMINVGLGLWYARRVRNSRDFFHAGRKLSLPVNAAALFATWFGAETIMGASAAFLEGGVLAVVEDPFGAVLCFFLVGRFFAKAFYRSNCLTINDYLGRRFDEKVAFVSALLMIPSYLGWIAAQLLAIGFILQTVWGVETSLAVWIALLVSLSYTSIGGMWSVSITDFVQGTLMILGLVWMLFYLFPDWHSFRTAAGALPADHWRWYAEWDWAAQSHYWAAWFTIGLGSIPSQDIFQRVMAARNEYVARWSAYVSAMLYLSVGLIPLILAMGIRQQTNYGGGEDFLLLWLIKQDNRLLQILFFGALLSAILSTASGAILAPASVLSENLLRPLFKDRARNDRFFLLLSRLAVLWVGLISALLTLSGQSIYELVAMSSAFSLVSLFVPLCFALSHRYRSVWGAHASMWLGLLVWGGSIVWPSRVDPLILGLLASLLVYGLGYWLEFFLHKKNKQATPAP